MKKFNWKSLVPHLIAVGVFLLIAVIYCKPTLEGKVLSQSDITQWKGMAQQSFKYKETHGHFPLWTNSAFGGMPAYQIAMDADNTLSPGYLHHLFTLFLPKPMSFFFLMCASFYFLTQVFKIDYRLGILGGIAYAYASFTSIIVVVGHDTQAFALGYVPAFIGAIFLVFQKRYLVGGALTAIFTSLLVGQNHPQVTYYFLLVAFFAGVAYLINWIKQKDFKHIAITLVTLGFAGTIGIATNAVPLATTLDFSKETMRNGTLNLDTSGNAQRKSSGLPIDYAFQWSYGKAETFTLLTPNIYGGGTLATPFSANSHLAKSLVDKGVPDDQATQVAEGLSPYAYWGTQPTTSGPVYVGAIMCFLFILGLIYLKGFDRWWMLAACILAIVMSWGSNLMGFNTFLFEHLPLYNKFRAPTMSLVIPQFLFPLLALMTLQQLIFKGINKDEALKKLKIAGAVVGVVFLILALMYTSFDYKSGSDPSYIEAQLTRMMQGNKDTANSLYHAYLDDRQGLFGADILRSLIFIGLAFVALWAVLKNKIKPVYALVAIVLLGSIDVLAEGRRYLAEDKFLDVETADQDMQPTPVDTQIMADTGFYRVLNLTRDYFQEGNTSYYHNSIGGYSPAKLSVIEDLLNYQLRGQSFNNRVLDMLNVKYVIAPGQQNQQQVQVNPGAMGDVWFVKAVDYVATPAAAMKALNNFNPKDTAVIEDTFKAMITAAPVADSTASIQLIKNDNDVITYKSSAKTPQVAVFSQIYYDRGWKAYVDNKELPIIKADYALRALSLPAGNHDIRFEFKPASYYNSSTYATIASVLVWLTIIAAIVFEARKNKNNTAPAK